MNTKTKTMLGVLLFGALLFVAFTAYQYLSKTYKPNIQIPLIKNTQTPANSLQPETTAEPESSTAPEESVYKAPDFTVFDAQGNEVRLSDFAGKPIVLNFWASWCPPCKSEMPHFNDVYNEMKEEDVIFMMVDLTDGVRETQKDGETYVNEQGYDFPVYFDNNQEASSAYGITSIPTTYFIDAEGNIATAQTGGLAKEDLLAGIALIHLSN